MQKNTQTLHETPALFINLSDAQVTQALGQLHQQHAKSHGNTMQNQQLSEKPPQQIVSADEYNGLDYSQQPPAQDPNTSGKIMVILIAILAIVLVIRAILEGISGFVSTLSQAGPTAMLMGLIMLGGLGYVGAMIWKAVR